MDNGFVNDVDDCFGNGEDVIEGVFGGVVAHASGRREDDDGWCGRKDIKEGEWAEIWAAIGVDGGNQADGARGDGVLQPLLAVHRCQLFYIYLFHFNISAEKREKELRREIINDPMKTILLKRHIEIHQISKSFICDF